MNTFREKWDRYTGWLLTAVLSIYLVSMLCVLPLVSTDGYKNIGTDKAVFFSRVSLALLPAALLLLSLRAFCRCRVRKPSVTVLCGFFYLLSILVSYFSSPYREKALWGEEGWYMGTLPLLLAAVSFMLIALTWEGKGYLRYLPLLALPVLVYVFFAGYLNRFGIFWGSYEVEDRVRLSTIGNINWYCGYILIPITFSMGLFLWGNLGKAKGFLYFFLILGFMTLTTQGSDSGFLCFAVIWFLLYALSREAEDHRKVWQLLLLFALACDITLIIRVTGLGEPNYTEFMENLMTKSAFPVFLTVLPSIVVFAYLRPEEYILVRWSEKNHRKVVRLLCGLILGGLCLFGILLWINTANGGKLSTLLGLPEDNFLYFNDKWGTFRGSVWRMSVAMLSKQTLWQHLVGVGPDCFYELSRTVEDPILWENLQSNLGSQILTNAHNEYLQLLITQGLLGMMSFGAMMLTGMYRFLRQGKRNPIAFSCGVALLAYTVNNLVGFQQTMNLVTMYMVLGLGEWSINERTENH